MQKAGDALEQNPRSQRPLDRRQSLNERFGVISLNVDDDVAGIAHCLQVLATDVHIVFAEHLINSTHDAGNIAVNVE